MSPMVEVPPTPLVEVPPTPMVDVPPSDGALVPPTGPQDRSLELAGLEALMQQQKLREAAQAAPLEVTTPKVEINWSTHKKEGMRLKRLMEESPDGSQFPHIKEMWNGTSAESWASIKRSFHLFTQTLLKSH